MKCFEGNKTEHGKFEKKKIAQSTSFVLRAM